MPVCYSGSIRADDAGARWCYRFVMIRLLAILFALITTPVLAASSAQTPHLGITLAAESGMPKPGGAVTLALDVRARPGWHIYWQNPGEAGLPPEVRWQLPSGASAGPLRHPVPSLLTVQGITSMVHEHDAVLLTDLRLPAGMAPGARLPITAKLQWLVCSETLCVPERAVLDLMLIAGDGSPDPAHAALFTNARAHQPAALDRQGSFVVKDGRIAVFVPLALPADTRRLQLFPGESGTLSLASPQTARKADGGVLIEGTAGDGPASAILTGLLRFEHGGGAVTGLSFTARAGTVPAGGALIENEQPQLSGFLLALGGAILGGLLLNLMPCVFPILSLKALSLAKAGESEAAARRDAIGYTMGAIAVLVALGGIILLLRGSGTQVGWAFQLQNPHIVALLILLALGIALNFAGLFELPAMSAGGRLAAQGGFAGSFFTGALAAFVATPCTGPFMAGALGAALLLPAPQALSVFAGLGLGLALPFLGIGFVPAIRSRLPRPGNWMNTLRRLLSIPMFVTALGLAWVLGQQTGVTAMAAALGLALLLGLALWWLGLRQHGGRAPWPALLPALAAVAAIAALPGAQPANRAAPAGRLAAERYSAARLAALRSEGRPVFVYMTADWCLSCKVNEASSLSSTSVAQAFHNAGIATLEGDWTRSDPEIEKLLAEHGRAGIPLYLFYPAGGGAPRELPQVLTPSMLTALAG